MEKYDVDHDDLIEFEEFVPMWKSILQLTLMYWGASFSTLPTSERLDAVHRVVVG